MPRLRIEEQPRHGGLLALAETGVVCFDYSVRQPVPIPEPHLFALEEHRA